MAGYHTRDGEQRVGFLTGVHHVLREFGVDPAEVAHIAGLDPEDLRDPDNVISYSATGRLLEACAVRTGCPHFGLLVGERAGTRALGLVGRLMRNAPSIGQAIRDLVANQRRYVRGGVPYLVVHGGLAWVGYAIYQPGMVGIDQMYDTAAAVGRNALRELGLDVAQEVMLSRKAPPDVTEYRRLFRPPIQFDAEQTAAVFSADRLSLPVPGADRRLRVPLERAVARYWAVAAPRVTDEVVRLLRYKVLFGEATADNVAEALAVHPRTLHRRLAAEGSVFRTLVSETRCEVARQLLAGTRMSITSISAALGYAEGGAFSHAFRRESGMTPVEWRAQKAAGLHRDRPARSSGLRAHALPSTPL